MGRSVKISDVRHGMETTRSEGKDAVGRGRLGGDARGPRGEGRQVPGPQLATAVGEGKAATRPDAQPAGGAPPAHDGLDGQVVALLHLIAEPALEQQTERPPPNHARHRVGVGPPGDGATQVPAGLPIPAGLGSAIAALRRPAPPVALEAGRQVGGVVKRTPHRSEAGAWRMTPRPRLVAT